MEVIQLRNSSICSSDGTSLMKSRAQLHRQSQISLLTSSSSAPTPSLVSSFSSASTSHRYSCSSTASVFSVSSPFFLNDEDDLEVDVEALSRSNTSSPVTVDGLALASAYHSNSAETCSDKRQSAAAKRLSQYRASYFSRSDSSGTCGSCLEASAEFPCIHQSPIGVNCNSPGSKAAFCATRSRRVQTLSSHNTKTQTLSKPSLSPKRSSLASASFRTDSGSRLSWYDPLRSDRFQLKYVDESLEELEESDSCDSSSDIEAPGDSKPVFQAIQESIVWFNTIAEIPIPAFLGKNNSNIPASSLGQSDRSKASLGTSLPVTASSSSHQGQPSHSVNGHVKKPSLVPLELAKASEGPILETEQDSLEDSDSLYNSSIPTSATTTTTSVGPTPTFASKEAAEAHAREQIDLEIEAAIAENHRLEEDRRSKEAQEDADFLRALHESIIAEKEAQARREDLEFLDRLFSKSRPVSLLSNCSSISSRSSVYTSCRNSTVLTALSPAPPKSPAKPEAIIATSLEDMPTSGNMEVSTPVSHSSRERPISAVREKKPKAKASAGDLYETSRESPSRPTFQRSQTSGSGGLRRLLGLSGRSTNADNSDDERYHAKTPRSSKKSDERPPMDRRSSESSTRSTHRHRSRHSGDNDLERECTPHRSHRHHSHHHHHHHHHSEESSPSKDKRRSREKTRSAEDSPTKRSRDKQLGEDPVPAPAPIVVAAAAPQIVEVPPVPDPIAAAPVEEKKKRRRKNVQASLGDLLRASRKIKEIIPEKPVRNVECITCLSDDIPSTQAAELECGHAFCNECLVRLFDLSLTDPAHMPPRCCDPKQHIPLQHVDKLLSTKTKILWNKKYQEFTTTNRRYCPAPDCGEWVRPKDFSNVEGVEIGKCPRCKLLICGQCGLKEHGTDDCPKDESLSQIRELGKELGWQRCYNCRSMVELERGCNHMTCRCTAEFCMICGLKWKTCECPWFNFPPEENDAPGPHLDENGRMVDDMDLAWGNDPRTEDDERVARQLAEDFADFGDDRQGRNAWAPLFTGALGEGILRLLSRTRHLEGAAIDRLRNAYANASGGDDFAFGGDSDDSDDDHVSSFLGVGRNHRRRESSARPGLRHTNSDDYDNRRRNRSSTYNLDWSPSHSREDLGTEDDFNLLPNLTRALFPGFFGGSRHRHNTGQDEFGIRRSFSDVVNGHNELHRDDIGTYGDLLEGDLYRMNRDFNIRLGGVGAA